MHFSNENHPHHIPLLPLLVLILFFSGCLSEIPLDVPPGDNTSIAIRGALVVSETPHVLVKITPVSNYQASEISGVIDGARVVLEDEQGTQITIPSWGRGEYFRDLQTNPGDLAIEPGKSYRLLVESPFGKSYISELEPLYSVPEPVEITQKSEIRTELNDIGNAVEQEFLRFYVTTPIVNQETHQGSYLKWNFSGVYRLSESADLPKICYLYEDLNLENAVVFNGQAARQEVLTEFYLMEEPYDYRFYEGYYLNVRQQSLSPGAFRYWDQVSKVVNRTGSIFEEPAGKVRGNIVNIEDPEEEVFGYFYATEETVIRYRVQRGESPPRYICLQSPQSPYYLCLNCLAHRNSTLEKPDYWED